MKSGSWVLFIAVLFFLQGCTSFSATNKRLVQANTIQSPTRAATKASFVVEEDRGSHQKALVILSLSGGGSRAAYWSASIMLALQEVYKDEGLDILKEVDIISSVSGGSLPAAYYVLSRDPEDLSGKVKSNRKWHPRTVKKLMTRNYRSKWLRNWFWPYNIVRFWFTAFDRTDIMAQTLTDNMFDVKTIGFDLRFKDLNPERPYIVLNATNGTKGSFGEQFTFTHEDFVRINSDINRYEVGRAVMASATFPAVFNYMTLKNYKESTGKKKYVHLFDGGVHDNLGLQSVQKIIEKNEAKYKKIIIILADAYTKSQGVDNKQCDPRKFFDYAVDLNFMDGVDSLLSANRDGIIKNFKDQLKDLTHHEVLFYHIQFSDSSDRRNRKKLNSIKTDFKIEKEGVAAIETAVGNIIVKENKCLQAIKEMLLTDSSSEQAQMCGWSVPAHYWND